MSKPLIFMFQLIGAMLLLLGAAPAINGDGAGLLIAGVVLVVIGGLGWRKRINDKDDKMKKLIVLVLVLALCSYGVSFAASKKDKAEAEQLKAKVKIQAQVKSIRDSAFNAGMRCIVNQVDERKFQNRPLNWDQMMMECQMRFGIIVISQPVKQPKKDKK